MALKNLLRLRRFRMVVGPEELTCRDEVYEKMEQIAEEHGCKAGVYAAGGELFPWVNCDKREIEDLNKAFRPLNIRVTDAPVVAMPSGYKKRLIRDFR